VRRRSANEGANGGGIVLQKCTCLEILTVQTIIFLMYYNLCYIQTIIIMMYYNLCYIIDINCSKITIIV